jgi:hypothetical protein
MPAQQGGEGGLVAGADELREQSSVFGLRALAAGQVAEVSDDSVEGCVRHGLVFRKRFLLIVVPAARPHLYTFRERFRWIHPESFPTWRSRVIIGQTPRSPTAIASAGM